MVAVAAPQLRAESPNGRINVGMIGVGNRGGFLLKNLLQIRGVHIRAICDIDRKRSKEAITAVTSTGQKEPKLYSEWKRLLEDKDIDAVVSALPCDLHAAAYLDTIAAGKDLYGEKPMCLTPADCDKVVAAAEGSKRIVQIGFQRRADPRFIDTIRQVHEGDIGDLIEGRIMWSNAWGPLYSWFGQRERSGDWMVEQAVHNWDVMNWVNGCMAASAMGFGRADLFREKQSDRNVHDYYSAVVQYTNGVIVNITHSWIAPDKFNEEHTRLVGTKGGIDFNTGTFSYRRSLKKPDRVGFTGPADINNTLLSLTAFVNSVRTRTAPVATVRHGRDAVLTCLLVRQAVDTTKVVSLSDLRA